MVIPPPLYTHQPVLLTEALTGLNIQPAGLFVDGTFGRGGHSAALLEQLGPAGRLLVMDRDPEAIAAAQARFAGDPRVVIQAGCFSQLQNVVTALGWLGQVAGILLDLGVSSPQLDNAERGFSFLNPGPLDMRMNPNQGQSVQDWLKQVKEADLASVLQQYGEERYARRIAKAIITARQQQPMTTTTQLAAIIAAANPRWEGHKHPATRSFQAMRIYINQELTALQRLLDTVLPCLKPGGRFAVISFHSLEDRLVKRFVQQQAQGGNFPPDLPVYAAQMPVQLRAIGKWRATEAEQARNPRARSALLRVMERLA